MKVLIISNIPSPYRIDYFNELGKKTELTVVFEAQSAREIKFNWNLNKAKNFKIIFLKLHEIEEKRVDWSILKHVKKNIFDIIVVTNYAYYTEMLALITLKIKRIPYYLEIDGGFIRQESKIKKLVKTFLISNARGYFSPSKMSDKYLEYYGANKDRIFRYPFTSLKKNSILSKPIEKNQKSEIRSKLNMTEKFIVLAVGQFIYRKGFDILIEACRYLNKEVGVFIVGGEPTKEYLELKSKYNLENMYFENFKSKERLAEYYKAADVFVLPSREDTWGLVINEAMAYGLPIITTNRCIAGMELIKNDFGGYIVKSNCVDSLVTCINKLYNDPIKKEEFSSINLKIIQEYSIENMADIHLNVFHKVVSQEGKI